LRVTVNPIRIGPVSSRRRDCRTKAGPVMRGPLAAAMKSVRFFNRSMSSTGAWSGPVRRSDACGRGRGGRREPCGRRWSPDGRESRDGACAPVCWVDRSASRSFSAAGHPAIGRMPGDLCRQKTAEPVNGASPPIRSRNGLGWAQNEPARSNRAIADSWRALYGSGLFSSIFGI